MTFQSGVMDLTGRGFSGANTWWAYVRSKPERQRLESLIGAALVDKRTCERLVHERDESLFESFGLSEETRKHLRSIEATTLRQLASAILGT